MFVWRWWVAPTKRGLKERTYFATHISIFVFYIYYAAVILLLYFLLQDFINSIEHLSFKLGYSPKIKVANFVLQKIHIRLARSTLKLLKMSSSLMIFNVYSASVTMRDMSSYLLDKSFN